MTQETGKYITPYPIINTTEEDLEFVFWLFDEAIAYQKRNGYPVWKGYDKEVLRNEVRGKTQYKIIIDDKIALIFSIMYADPMLWREKEKGDALYVHRLVVNPAFKGRKLFGVFLEWALNHAREKRIPLMRMDTWGDNPVIIDYYKSFGFRFVENYTTPNTTDLSIPHRNLYLALLEMEVT